jgi:hypothetical protein
MSVPVHRAVTRATGWVRGIRPASLIVVAAAAVTVVAGTVAAAAQSPLSVLSKQPLYAGYVAHATSFQAVSGQVTVPVFKCPPTSKPGGNDVFYQIALGSKDEPAEEVYAGGYCNGSAGVYEAGYSFNNGRGAQLTTVSPGDVLTGSVSYNTTTGRYTFSLQDVTSGASIKATRGCPTRAVCETAGAMAVAGTFGLTGFAPRLTDYKTVNFSNITVTDQAGTTSGLTSSSWKTTEYVETSGFGSGTTFATPGSLQQSGTAFTDTWLARN